MNTRNGKCKEIFVGEPEGKSWETEIERGR
jgi:hypothetical protein